ncbi:MAG: hexose kinase [Roseitalea porphyridii]|jgi:6-phosphofructokinase 2|uniref:1-phosphofructokinase family hexose kinase n=1 Tax=Roseitalea porphyridii TaxID=1852022 RepID=UPI0032EB6870
MDHQPVVTITLNPAVDIAADVDTVRPDVKLRCKAPQFDPGGGGINVARAITKLGGRARALIAVGGATGDMLATMLAGEAIDTIAVDTGGQTRQSFTARETSSGHLYRFVLPGPEWTQATDKALFEALATLLTPGTLAVLSGSLPPGAGAEIVERIEAACEKAGAALVADTSGPVLTALCARSGQPLHLLRMDRDEALTVSGRAMSTPSDFAAYGAELVSAGVADHIVIGLGARGSVGVSAAERILCSRPVDTPLSAVGAGDSFVGAMVLALARGLAFDTALAHGTAAAASAVVTPGTALCERATTEAFIAEVETTRLA